MRVVELEGTAAARPIVRPQREVQQFMRQHEDEIVVVELLRECGIDDQTSRRENAHGRHAIVERHPHGGGEAER